jgi:RNA polymerase primary sigma factor
MMRPHDDGVTMGYDLDAWYVREARRRGKPLARDEERELLRRLDEARLAVAEHALASPPGLRRLGELAALVRHRPLEVHHVVRVDGGQGASAVLACRFLRRWAASRRAMRVATTPMRRTALARTLLDLRLASEHVDHVIDLLEQAHVRQLAGDRLAARDLGMSPASLAHGVEAVRVARRALGLVRERLTEGNLRLVALEARRYRNRGLELADLVQEGTIGLMRAVELFDTTRGVAFSTYATWWIRQAMRRALERQSRPIRLSGVALGELGRLRRRRAELTMQLRRAPTLGELADGIHLTEAKTRDLLLTEQGCARSHVSLDDPADGEDAGARTVADTLSDPRAVAPFEATAAKRLVEQCGQLLAPLRPRERDVLRRRYGLDRRDEQTLEEIGTHYGVSRQCIYQLSARAMERLRATRRCRRLRAYYRP